MCRFNFLFANAFYTNLNKRNLKNVKNYGEIHMSEGKLNKYSGET